MVSETREWTTVDKSDWGPGPWADEPDKIHWIDPATDLDCLMHRGPSGAWCGYVGVTRGHPAFDVDYNDVRVADGEYPDVHGGLTYSARCQDTDDESKGICHVPFAGRPHEVWWIGFDCAHSGDATPKFNRYWAETSPALLKYAKDDVYRDRAYVENEVRNLAAQLKAAAGG